MYFSYLEPVCCSMSSSNYCFLNCIQISQEAGQVVWYSHLFQNPFTRLVCCGPRSAVGCDACLRRLAVESAAAIRDVRDPGRARRARARGPTPPSGARGQQARALPENGGVTSGSAFALERALRQGPRRPESLPQSCKGVIVPEASPEHPGYIYRH